MIVFIKELFITLAMIAAFFGLHALAGDEYDKQVKDTDCNCVSQRLNELDQRYGNDSKQSQQFFNKLIYGCNITSNEEFNACSENI